MELEQVVPALRGRLGPDATAGLVKLLDDVRDEWTDGVIEAVGDRFERRLTEEISKARVEMAEAFAAVRQEIAQGNAELRAAIADQKFEILKWTFIFWTGQFLVTASFLVMLLRAFKPG